MKKNWYKSFIPPEPICSSLLPPTSKRDCKFFLFTHLPILGWLWSYQLKFLIGDFIAGITVAIMHIPQGKEYCNNLLISLHVWSINNIIQCFNVTSFPPNFSKLVALLCYQCHTI